MTVIVNMEADSSKVESALSRIALRFRGIEQQANVTAKTAQNMGNVKINVDPALRDIKRLNTEMLASQKSMAKGFEGVTRSIQSAIAGIGVSLTAAFATAGLVKASDSVTALNNRLALVVGRGKELESTLTRLYAVARDSGGSIAGAVDIFNRFGLALRETKPSAETLIKIADTVQKSIAITGGSAASAEAAIFQLGQGMSAGALRGQELNSVMEQAPRLAQAFADELGVSLGGLKKIAEDGGLTTEVVMKAILNQSEAIQKQFAQTNRTVGETFTVFSDQLTKLVGTFAQMSGLTGAIVGGLNRMTDAMMSIQPEPLMAISQEFSYWRVTLTYLVRDTMMVAGGIGNIFVAIAKRIADSMPFVITPMIYILKGALYFIEYFAIRATQTILSMRRQTKLSITRIFGNQLAQAINDAFNADNIYEFRAALDEIAYEISVQGKRWYNLAGNIARVYFSWRNTVTEFLIGMGLIEQRLLSFQRSSLDSFGTLFGIFAKIGSAIAKELVLMPIVAKAIYALSVLSGYVDIVINSIIGEFYVLGDAFGMVIDSIVNAIKGFGSSRSPFADLWDKWIEDFKEDMANTSYVNIVLRGMSPWYDMIYAAFRSFSKNEDDSFSIGGFFKRMFNDVLNYTKSIVPRIIKAVEYFLDKVREGFRDLYIAVVGNSYWPDTMDGIINEARSKLSIALSIVNGFASRVKNIFSSIMNGDKINLELGLSLDESSIKKYIKDMAKEIVRYSLEIATLLDNISPIIIDSLALSLAIGFATFIAESGSGNGLIKFVSSNLLLGFALFMSEATLEPLLDEEIFYRAARNLGEGLGNAIRGAVKAVPELLEALRQVADGFGDGLLSQLGIVGDAIRGLANITGVSGILNLILFGTGLAALLGKFKLLKSIAYGVLTVLSGKSFGGVGKEGIVAKMLFGPQGPTAARLIIGQIIGIYTALMLIPNVLTGDFTGIATGLGLMGLMILGPRGSLAAIDGIFAIIIKRLGVMLGLTTATAVASDFDGFKKFAELMKEFFPQLTKLKLFEGIAGVFANWRGYLVGAVMQMTLLSQGITAFYTKAQVAFTAAAARMRATATAAGGATGLMGRMMFGKWGTALAIVGLITALMTTTANAAEDSFMGSMASSGLLDVGLLGLMILGPMLGKPIGKLAAKLFGSIGKSALASLRSVINVNTISTLFKSAFSGALTAIRFIFVNGFRLIGTALVAMFSSVAATIASVIGIAIGGFFVYKWITSETDPAEAALESLRARASEVRSTLEGLGSSSMVADVFKASEIRVDINAMLEESTFAGLSEAQIKSVERATKTFEKVVSRNNDILTSEGELTRAQIAEVEAATRALSDTIAQGKNPANNPDAVSQLRQGIIDSLGNANLISVAEQSALANKQYPTSPEEIMGRTNDSNLKMLFGALAAIDSMDMSKMNPEKSTEVFKGIENFLNKYEELQNVSLLGKSLGWDKALAKEMPGLAKELTNILGEGVESYMTGLDATKYSARIDKIMSDLAAIGMADAITRDQLINEIGEKQLAEIESAARIAATDSGAKRRSTSTFDTGENVVTGPLSDAQVQGFAKLKEVVRSALETGVKESQPVFEGWVAEFNEQMSNLDIGFEVDTFDSEQQYSASVAILEQIIALEKKRTDLQPGQFDQAKALTNEIEKQKIELLETAGSLEQKLSSISGVVEGMPSVDDVLLLDDATINQIVKYGMEILRIMQMIRMGGASAGPGALNAPVGGSFRAQAAATLGVLENQIVPYRGNGGTGTGSNGDGGGGGAAETWWESFKNALSSMDLSLEEEFLATINSQTVERLVSASAKYQAAQEAINNSTAKEVELRKQSLAVMQQARQEAIASLNDGTVGGLQATLESLGANIDEDIVGGLSAAQSQMAVQMATRLAQLRDELPLMQAGSQAAMAASAEIRSLSDSLEDMSNASSEMRESFASNFEAFLKGEKDFKGMVEGLLDTFTSTVIKKFTEGFTDSLFEALGLDQFFNKIFSSMGNMFSGMGGGGGGLLGGLVGSLGGGGLLGDMLSFIGMAEGGQILGPGTGTSDSILARLSNGEFVVNAATTKRWLPFLEQINANDGRLPAFATGGMVGPSRPAAFKAATSSTNSRGVRQEFNINVTGDVSRQTRKEIVEMIPQITAGVNMTNKEKGSR